MQSTKQSLAKLPPDVSRFLYVKQLPYKITSEEMFELFGKFGAIRQIRLGNTPTTKGRAFVVYEDIFDAQVAVEKLKGFNVGGRYLIVTYHKPDKVKKAEASAEVSRAATAKGKEELEALKAKYDIKTPGSG